MVRARAFTLIELMIVITILAVIIALSLPNFLEARRQSNEAAAVAAMKTLVTVELQFWENDRDNNGLRDYANFPQLGVAGLISGPLAAGRSNGYEFDVQRSTTNPSDRFFAIANPIVPGSTGFRSYVTNHAGVIYYSMTQPAVMNNTTCDIPPGWTAIGQ